MEYVPLKITTVKANTSLTFDLYIYFKDHYLCYANKGIEIGEDKLEKLINQEVADFYVPAEQVDNVTIFMDESLNQAIYADGISDEERASVVSGVVSTSLEHMNENPTEKNYEMTQKAAKGLREVISKNPLMLKRLFGKKGKESERIIDHSLNVCALATKLAEHLKLPENEIEDIATASLIHDIGLTKLPPHTVKLFEKPSENFTPEEKLKYGQHSKISVDFLAEKPFISKAVENLIINHEENLQGTGPLKVRKLTPAMECISLVNAYDKRIISHNETPSQAFRAFQIDFIGLYSLELLQRFELVLKEEGLLDS